MPEAGRRSLRLSRFGQAVAVAGMAILVAAFVLVWALPNVAGPEFVEVRALVAPRASDTGPTIVIGGLAPSRAAALDVGVEVVNHYPLQVVVGTDGAAFQAVVYRRDGAGKLVRVWQTSTDDPVLEEGSDSPVGGGTSAGAAQVPTGTSRHDLTGSTAGFSLIDATGNPLAAGVYYLRVWAYGIASPLVPMALNGGVDPLGPPSNG
jgi:hypothetical protein